MVDIPILPIVQQEAVVVSRQGREMQILDPDTYETVTITAPPSSVEGDTIPVIKWKDKLYAIGD
jgi:NMD protein affecting ribosome stability and mRNA decay